MLRRLVALTLVALAAAACGGASFEGTWRLVSFEVGGEPFPFEGPLFLEIDDDGFRAETPCNSMSGQFGGDIASTLMMCADVRNDGERHMTTAFAGRPVEVDGRLVFVEDDVRLIYEPFVEISALDLIDVLGDERRNVDESALPPESATGSVPPDYDALIPVPSPSPLIDLFLGLSDGRPCIVYGTETTIGAACTGPRDLAFRTRTENIPQNDPSYLRVAIMPDAFADAADRSGLGAYETNLLIIADDVAPGTQVLTNSAGRELRLDIGEPSSQPPSDTVPPTPAP